MADFFQRLLALLRPSTQKRVVEQMIRSTEAEEKRTADLESQERIREKVAKEDFLLRQIDEFRDKAKQLQDLLISKETKVQELQVLVSEREGKAEELAHILNQRQEQADLIMKDFNKKVDELSEKVTNKMTDIEASISNQVADVKRTSMEQLEANRKLNEEQIAANKKLSEEQLATNKQFLEEQAIANKKLSEGQIAEVKQLLDNTTAQLESIKTDLSEKVHSENVKCYRNIQHLFTEFDSKIEKMGTLEKTMDSVRGYVKCLTWFSVINFVLLAAFILFSLGVFKF
ncbi:MAG: hypothetical protein IKL06_02825 [Lachnospiraceae bacterium]|nr:hypothetical protein [Lachnospiraceae bacterium]